MTYLLDLFAGIGGFALGAHWAGLRFDRHFFSEVDDYAIRTYSRRFPDAEPLGDIRAIQGAALPRGDWIIAGGFPCQDISVAGKGAGLAGERSGLWYEYARLIGELRPRYAIMENVGALAFRGLDSVLGSLAALGYDAEWQDIRASDVGAPHRRERLWIVAYPECTERGPECFSRHGLAQREDRLPQREEGTSRTRVSGENVADSDRGRLEGQRERSLSGDREPSQRDDVDGCGSPMCDANRQRLAERKGQSSDNGAQFAPALRANWWATEPDVCGMADGISARLDGGIDASAGMDSEGNSRSKFERNLRRMWEQIATRASSSGQGSDEQLAREFNNLMPGLPYSLTLGERQGCMADTSRFMLRLRQACEALGALRNPSDQIAQAWESLSDEEKDRVFLGALGRADWASGEWPGVTRVTKSIPARVDRLKCLGNSIVPEIAELIFAQPAFDEWRAAMTPCASCGRSVLYWYWQPIPSPGPLRLRKVCEGCFLNTAQLELGL